MSALVLLSLWAMGCAVAFQQTLMPLLPNVPFLTVWNIPTEPCETRYSVDLGFSQFDIVLNQNQSFMGDNITIFYDNRLGLYPFYTPQGAPVNGGVPQNASLPEHLQYARADIKQYIPNSNFSGLAIVDWESWRPLWLENWDAKQVYQEASRALVRQKHPNWTMLQVESEAQSEFEEAARAFVEDTLQLGRKMRPGGRWGFYGMPDCFNQYSNTSVNYTGKCAEVQMSRDDELGWLWNASSALYPSIYLGSGLTGKGDAVRLYVQNTVLEAMRCSEQVTPISPSVLPYASIVYETQEFLSQEDLVYTIGESAALGAVGIVLWGSEQYAASQASCTKLKTYLQGILGVYLLNVTTAAELCSKERCNANGRCMRKTPNNEAYLHLNPASFTILQNLTVKGALSEGDREFYNTEFGCQCYSGYKGESCTQTENGSSPGLRTTMISLLFSISLLWLLL
ncbi:hyaluronidase-1-like [Amia ocellicauda]|uniref:hyaluronidase-1-like n=1 Tax=Amia ocellicauda TaxID=2972642 RepID=UPI00346491D2